MNYSLPELEVFSVVDSWYAHGGAHNHILSLWDRDRVRAALKNAKGSFPPESGKQYLKETGLENRGVLRFRCSPPGPAG